MPHYKLTSPSGKVYHGITVKSVERRLEQHRYNAIRGLHYPLYKAIRKYGFDSFKVEVLSDSIDADELWALEVAAIAADNSLAPNGYNATVGGDGCVGLTWGDGSREKKRCQVLTEPIEVRVERARIGGKTAAKKWQTMSANERLEAAAKRGAAISAAKAKKKALRTPEEEAARVERHAAAMRKRKAAETPEQRARVAAFLTEARAAAKAARLAQCSQ